MTALECRLASDHVHGSYDGTANTCFHSLIHAILTYYFMNGLASSMACISLYWYVYDTYGLYPIHTVCIEYIQYKQSKLMQTLQTDTVNTIPAIHTIHTNTCQYTPTRIQTNTCNTYQYKPYKRYIPPPPASLLPSPHPPFFSLIPRAFFSP